jgi:hypothetical protein
MSATQLDSQGHAKSPSSTPLSTAQVAQGLDSLAQRMGSTARMVGAHVDHTRTPDAPNRTGAPYWAQPKHRMGTKGTMPVRPYVAQFTQTRLGLGAL